mmetsp:Transcript_10408/g.14699  ORF Transcript_10408/g.14699 Transcript_10408/m.14699 type:complete len:215 (+) Transcript_10408:612-1256(+)
MAPALCSPSAATSIFALCLDFCLFLLCDLVSDGVVSFAFGLVKYPSGHVFLRRGGFLGLNDSLEGGTANQTLWYCFCAYVSDFPGGGGVMRTFRCSGSSEERGAEEAFLVVGVFTSALEGLATGSSFTILRRFSTEKLPLLLLLFVILFLDGVSIFSDFLGVSLGLGDVLVLRNFFLGAGVDTAPSCIMVGLSVVTILSISSQNKCSVLHLSQT